MISVTDLKPGQAFWLDREPYRVVDYRHTKLGRGPANIRVKVRSLRTGNLVKKVFISGTSVEPLEIETRELQYLYRDSKSAYLMDPRSFEQFSLPLSVLGKKTNFLKEGELIKVLFCEDEPLSVELPVSLVFQVVQAPPGVRGDSVSASFKQVTLDNGLVVKVPLFVEKGDKVKIDTRTGNYLERIK